MDNFLDILFPKSCSICSKKGTYLCKKCKKLFKRNLPECYICRELSSNYVTHRKCKMGKGQSALDAVFVAWEYNSLTSDLLKKYKYSYVYDISNVLSSFLIENVRNSTFSKLLNNTFLTNVPIPANRLRERGFNQTLEISKSIASKFQVASSNDLLRRKNTYDHQAMKDKGAREGVAKNDFIVKSDFDISTVSSIVVFDDVLTTGITLECICERLRDTYGDNLVVYGICMFRGRPYYLEDSKI